MLFFLNYVYPQLFWVDFFFNTSTSCPPVPPFFFFPPPVPDRRRKLFFFNRERRSVGFLVFFLLILLALTGVGLSISHPREIEPDFPCCRQGLEEQLTFCDMRCDLRKKNIQRLVLTALFLLFRLPGNPAQRDLPLEWEPISGHAFTNGIQYRDQGLVINETGLYFVYSNVLFRGSVCSSQVLTHIVYKKNPTSPGSYVLMEDKGINYCTSQKTWARKSYLGALFQLRKMDSLHVNVSKIALVNFEESKTFFGLFKL
ncbi:TNFL6 factor, partial [Phaetusa simplex]|nr:TNFL6 factor [Phaetusa simplex]